jgi:hypothetical protein
MLRGEDIVLLLKLVDTPADWTVRSLESETTIPRSVVQRAIKRLAQAGLYDERGRRVLISQSEEFLLHGLRYVFPGRLGGPTLGVPTAWAAEPLVGELAPTDELPPVWPAAKGTHRGLEFAPVHPAALEASARDPALGERLALVDALRAGGPRIKGLAAELLIPRLAPPQREHRAA